jgi:hypothetical protein
VSIFVAVCHPTNTLSAQSRQQRIVGAQGEFCSPLKSQATFMFYKQNFSLFLKFKNSKGKGTGEES